MAIMNFENVNTPPTTASQEGTYYVKRADNPDCIDIYVVSKGAVKKQEGDGSGNVVSLSGSQFLPDGSFSTFPNIDNNHLCNINSSGVFTAYIENPSYDSAWVRIFENSGRLKISGATITRIVFFSELEPSTGSFISTNTTLIPEIPASAKLAIVTLAKSNNPGGYANLRALQIGAGATRKEVKEISMIDDFTITGYYLNNSTGKPVANASYKITDFIPLNKGLDITFTADESTSSARIVFYDEGKNMVNILWGGASSLVQYRDEVIKKESFPSNAAYFRANASITNAEAYVFNSSISLIDRKMANIKLPDDNVIPRFLQEVSGKNLVNINDLLYGYTFSSDTGYIQSANGIMSNKMFLSPGTYALQGLKAFSPLTNRLVFFNDKDEYLGSIAITVDSTLKGTVTLPTNTTVSFYAHYARLVLQFNTTYLSNLSLVQFEKGSVATAYEPFKSRLIINPVYERPQRMVFLTGASNAMPGNGWFENACRMLGYKCRNAAISGDSVMGHATMAWRGTLYTPAELEEMDIFCTSHTHNYNVAYENPSSSILCKTVEEYESKGFSEDTPLAVPLDKNNPAHNIVPLTAGVSQGHLTPDLVLDERYAAGYDYLIKKYIKDCYDLRLNPSSKWYGTKGGKPVRIVLCSYWHDGYTVLNEALKELAIRHGAVFCDIANNVGFSYRQTDPSNPSSRRISAEFCNNSTNNVEDIPINGVTYTGMGWHATRDVNSWLMLTRGAILADVLRRITF